MTLLIRAYDPARDRESLIELAQKLALHHGRSCALSPFTVDRAIQIGGLTVLVAETPESLVGYASLQRRLTLASGTDVFHLTELMVDPLHSRRGIGKALMRAAARRAVKQGIPAMTLAVKADNHAARAFYQALGFEVSESTGYRGSLMGLALNQLAE